MAIKIYNTSVTWQNLFCETKAYTDFLKNKDN